MSVCYLPTPTPAWHHQLLSFLGLIRARAYSAHRHLPPAERDEAVSEITANVTVQLATLSKRREIHPGLIAAMIRFAIRGRRSGRRIGASVNRRDVLSPVPREDHHVLSLDAPSHAESGLTWRDVLPDSRQADPAEIACTRIDLEVWLNSLPDRLRQVALALAAGDRPGELAAQLGISSGRLSQLRRELHERWIEFSSEPSTVAA